MAVDIRSTGPESLFEGLTSRNMYSDFLDLIDDVCTPDKGNNSFQSQCRRREKLSRNNIPCVSVSPPYTKRELPFGDIINRTNKRPSDQSICRPLKRLADVDYAESPSTKKLRKNLEKCFIKSTTKEHGVFEHLNSTEHLVANGSRDYRLPTIPGKHGDLKSISVHTMSDVVSGVYSNQMRQVTVIDCRYPYEFEGGHIRGAVNMYKKDDIISLLKESMTSPCDRVLIFHCEFSSERGPKMSRFLREKDRAMHRDSYPELTYPEIYLLHGGYKAFFSMYPDLCEPTRYTPMLHKDHKSDLRHFRVKSKSWSAGDKQETTRRSKSRLSFET